MKKLLYTAAFTFITLLASAQFTVLTTVSMPDDDEDFEVSSLTDNMGVGYTLNDKIMVGVVKNGENYDLFGRYDVKFLYLSLQAPTENTTDNMSIGVGYSLNVYDKLYLEPNYTMPVNEDDDGNREGSFNLGVAYRF